MINVEAFSAEVPSTIVADADCESFRVVATSNGLAAHPRRNQNHAAAIWAFHL